MWLIISAVQIVGFFTCLVYLTNFGEREMLIFKILSVV